METPYRLFRFSPHHLPCPILRPPNETRHVEELKSVEQTENYVSSNAKIKKALGVDKMPVNARTGLQRTLESFKEGTRIMITIQDLYNIVGNKIANETGKAIIRNNFPPQIAEQMCNAID